MKKTIIYFFLFLKFSIDTCTYTTLGEQTIGHEVPYKV